MPRTLAHAIVLVVNLALWLRFPRLLGRAACRTRRVLNVARPVTLTEKLLWRRLIDTDPGFVTVQDKLQGKHEMRRRLPSLAIAPVRWQGTDPQALPDAFLRPGFAVKTNHGCNYNILIRDEPVDRAAIRQALARWLAGTYGRRDREWAYGQIVPQAFVEDLIVNAGGAPLVDLNVYCCRGRPIYAVAVVGEKTKGERVAFYRPDGRRMVEVQNVPGYTRAWLPPDFALPATAEDPFQVAAILSRDFPLIRVDMMLANGRVHGCELTPYPADGRYSRLPVARELAAAWDLTASWFLTTPQSGWRGLYRHALRRLAQPRAAEAFAEGGFPDPLAAESGGDGV
ncbi:ATP-grasp fold amidoligase family protein [Zavarzinia sp. CC-PAN008]|uniref:ATP-grasp fold amidoligase family protein n=1 Tax=Zavarzinia sp. CC-PAN008 TaxID=3243332 RepID=UPI003F742105